MAGLANSEAAEIDGLRLQQRSVSCTLVERQRGIAFKVMELVRLESLLDPLPHVTAKACFVARRNAEVFVHVKERQPRPVYAPGRNQRFQKLNLRIASAQNNCSRALACQ